MVVQINYSLILSYNCVFLRSLTCKSRTTLRWLPAFSPLLTIFSKAQKYQMCSNWSIFLIQINLLLFCRCLWEECDAQEARTQTLVLLHPEVQQNTDLYLYLQKL